MFKRVWNNIGSWGTQYCSNAHERKTVPLMNRVSIISTLMMTVFCAFALFVTDIKFLPYVISFVVAFFLISVFNYFGLLQFARIFAASIPILVIGFICLANKEIGGDKYFLVPASMIPMILYRERWKYIVFFDIYVAAFFFITYYQSHFPQLLDITISDPVMYYYINMTSLFFTSFIIIHYFIGTNNEYEKEILQKNELLDERNKEITDSIRYAKRLQQAILATPEEIKKQLPDSFLLYQPKDIVAGDFYFFEKHNHHLFLAAADCTGHGVPGALVSVVCSNALNRSVREFNITEPGAVLTKTRELVLDTFQKSTEEIKDGMDISLLVIDEQTKKVMWSGANNSLWVYQSEKNEILEVRADKQAIGLTDQAKDFTTHHINYSSGDVFYLFTDGYADQFGGPKGKKLKYSQLKEYLIQSSKQDLDQLKKQLEQNFEDWKGELEQVDDVCIIAIRL